MAIKEAIGKFTDWHTYCPLFTYIYSRHENGRHSSFDQFGSGGSSGCNPSSPIVAKSYPERQEGQLADGYPESGAGYNQMVLDGLGVDRDSALEYIKSNSQSYVQFENWVVEQRGGSIPQAEIDVSNAAIRGYNHDDDTRKSILSAAGMDDDGSILDAVNPNNIDDWTEFHNSL